MMTPTPTPPPDDLAAQCRQCAADMASRNLLVAEAARGRAPGLLNGAADEMERVRAVIDRHVRDSVFQTSPDTWRAARLPNIFRSHLEAEAAYRKVAFPGLDETTKGA
jgi:hypothetical protein